MVHRSFFIDSTLRGVKYYYNPHKKKVQRARWLAKADEEERRRGKGFMDRLKKRWDEQYPEKRDRSKQNLRDNAVRFKREINEH